MDSSASTGELRQYIDQQYCCQAIPTYFDVLCGMGSCTVFHQTTKSGLLAGMWLIFCYFSSHVKQRSSVVIQCLKSEVLIKKS